MFKSLVLIPYYPIGTVLHYQERRWIVTNSTRELEMSHLDPK